jgi:twinkle protein
MNSDWKWAVFSPENKPYYLHIQPLSEKIIGKPFFNDGAMSKGELEIVLDKLQNHIRFIEPDFENRTMKAIKRLALDAINNGGVDGVIIDPWNKVEMTLSRDESETQYVGRTLLDWQYFAREHNIFMGIVAHPTKMVKNPSSKFYPVPTLYNLSGGANWFNGIDNGVTIYRNIEKNYIEAHIQKIKFKNHGKLGIKYFRYNEFNGRLDEISKEETKKEVIKPDDFTLEEPELNLKAGHYADEL